MWSWLFSQAQEWKDVGLRTRFSKELKNIVSKELVCPFLLAATPPCEEEQTSHLSCHSGQKPARRNMEEPPQGSATARDVQLLVKDPCPRMRGDLSMRGRLSSNMTQQWEEGEGSHEIFPPDPHAGEHVVLVG